MLQNNATKYFEMYCKEDDKLNGFLCLKDD